MNKEQALRHLKAMKAQQDMVLRDVRGLAVGETLEKDSEALAFAINKIEQADLAMQSMRGFSVAMNTVLGFVQSHSGGAESGTKRRNKKAT